MYSNATAFCFVSHQQRIEARCLKGCVVGGGNKYSYVAILPIPFMIIQDNISRYPVHCLATALKSCNDHFSCREEVTIESALNHDDNHS